MKQRICVVCGKNIEHQNLRVPRCRTCHHARLTCPECGGPKFKRSKLCGVCSKHPNATGQPAPYELCQCGGWKKQGAKLCTLCQSESSAFFLSTEVPPELPDREWMIAFTHFFLADGSVGTNQSSSRMPRPILHVSQKATHAACLQEICERLGGGVYLNKTKGYDPQHRWHYSRGVIQTLALVKAMIDAVVLEHPKADELRLVRDWLQWRLTFGAPGPDEVKQALDYKRQLRLLKTTPSQ